jgi:hypothetical protein
MQVTEDGYRNAIVKLTGILDTSDLTWTSVISLNTFTNNEQNARLTGYRFDLIEWSISNTLEVNLYWNSTTPQQLFPLAGRGRINGSNYGGFVPNQSAAGYDGSINLVTSGWSTTQNFSIVLELIKLYKA